MFPSSGLIQESLVELLGRNAFLSCYLGHLNMSNWTQVVPNCKIDLSHQTEWAKGAEGVHLQDKHLAILSYPKNYLSNSSTLKSTPKAKIVFSHVLFEQPAVILTEVPASQCLVDPHSDLLKRSHQGWLHILVNEPGALHFGVQVHNFSWPYKCTYILDHPHSCQQTRMLSQGFVEACRRCQRACLRKSWCCPWSPCTYFLSILINIYLCKIIPATTFVFVYLTLINKYISTKAVSSPPVHIWKLIDTFVQNWVFFYHNVLVQWLISNKWYINHSRLSLVTLYSMQPRACTSPSTSSTTPHLT